MNIIIASPHERNSRMEQDLKNKFPYLNCAYVRTPKKLISFDFDYFSPDWIFFPHWSWKVPSEIFLQYQCVIFHMTDLPFGRGGTPLQNLIVRGLRSTKICALKCEEGIDTGPVYCRRPLDLSGSAEEILGRAHFEIQDMIEEMLECNPVPQPQCGEIVEFDRRTASDGNLESISDIDTVYDYIRMLDAKGYPSAFLRTSNLQFEFTNVEISGKDLVARVRIKKECKHE